MSTRVTHPRVVPLIAQRWSPRSFDAATLPDEDLAVILEAAGLAPSAYNVQPWRFIYARREDAETFARFLEPLVEFNQSWAKDASVLLYVLSEETTASGDGERRPNHSHSFDAGAAWALLSLQADALGYRAHAMTGVDFAKARAVLNVPEGLRIEAAVALGRQAPAERLPDALREREVVSTRKPVSEIAFEGAYPASR